MTAMWDYLSPVVSASLLLTAFAFLIIMLSTRLITGKYYSLACASTSVPYEPPTIPYWIPYYAHLINLWSADLQVWLEQWSQGTVKQILAIQILGMNIKMITDRTMLLDIFESHASRLSFDGIRWYVLVKVFGAASTKHKLYLEAQDDITSCLQRHFGHRCASNMVLDINTLVQDHIPDLVSTNQSIIDQEPWERAANSRIVLTKGLVRHQAVAVEVSLYALIRTFVGHLTISGFWGTEYTEDYDLFLVDLWNLDSCWKYLALGLPRWLPISGLGTAYAARRNLLHVIGAHHSLNAGHTRSTPREPCGRTCRFLNERNSIWRIHKTPADVRIPADLGLVWTMVVKNANVVFWMLLNIYAMPDLAQNLRKEIQPYATVTYTASNSKIVPPSRLKLDASGLSKYCPLLKACFYECLRLYSNPLLVKQITTLLIPKADPTHSPSSYTTSFAPRTYVAALYPHVRSNPSAFESPGLFLPYRFIKITESGRMVCELGEFNPWGLGPFVCPGRKFAESQILSFVAAIIAFWEVEPAADSGWTAPSPKRQSVVATPSTDIRVILRARSK